MTGEACTNMRLDVTIFSRKPFFKMKMLKTLWPFRSNTQICTHRKQEKDRERERERQRERERHREEEGDRQTERGTKSEYRQIYKSNRNTERQTDGNINKVTDRQTFNIALEWERKRSIQRDRHCKPQTDRETERQTKHREHSSFSSLLIYGLTINSLFPLATYLSEPGLWVLRKRQTVFSLHTSIRINTWTSTNAWKCWKRLKTHSLFDWFFFFKISVLIKTPFLIGTKYQYA